MNLFDQPLVCVDIETDGMNHMHGHVIEVAAIRIENGEIVDEFTSLINPQTAVPYFITKLTGITTADVQDAPTFTDIADRLLEIMDGAIFVAHNVRFDYSFLKQEFRRIESDFEPRQLCTVKLSRALYPDERSHKLASLIERHDFTYSARHRAYDDAHVLWQFLSHAHANFPTDILTSAIGRQLKQPSLPKYLDKKDIDNLPTGPGVYIFNDEAGRPLYIGKSVNIRRRVMSHFTRDTEEYREFKIAQSIRSITTRETGGELEALLLESHLIKTEQPLYNRLLRRANKLIVARQVLNSDGYLMIQTEELTTVLPQDFEDILALYTKRGTAKESLLRTVKTFDLCPKLSGLEKATGACFSYQLGKCKGACIGKESPASYNQRLLTAFEHKRIDAWPYDSPMLIQEQNITTATAHGFVVDQWCIVGTLSQEEDFEPELKVYDKTFDYDAYKILRSFMTQRQHQLRVTPFSLDYFTSD
jgi:DNA polymerase-3 subunit epsilon